MEIYSPQTLEIIEHELLFYSRNELNFLTLDVIDRDVLRTTLIRINNPRASITNNAVAILYFVEMEWNLDDLWFPFDLVRALVNGSETDSIREFGLKTYSDTIIDKFCKILGLRHLINLSRDKKIQQLAQWRPMLLYHKILVFSNTQIKRIQGRERIHPDDGNIHTLFRGWGAKNWIKDFNIGMEFFIRYKNQKVNYQKIQHKVTHNILTPVTPENVSKMIKDGIYYEDNGIVYHPLMYILTGIDPKDVLKFYSIDSLGSWELDVDLVSLFCKHPIQLISQQYDNIPPLTDRMIPTYLKYMPKSLVAMMYYTGYDFIDETTSKVTIDEINNLMRHNRRAVAYLYLAMTLQYNENLSFFQFVDDQKIYHLRQLVLNLDQYTPQQIIDKAGKFMLFPQHINTDEKKFSYYIRYLNDYYGVFERDNKPTFNINIEGSRDEVQHYLEQFSDSELMKKYPFPGLEWEDPNDLRRRLATILTSTEPRWTFIRERKRCLNPGDIDYFDELIDDDPINPVVSYGLFNQYRCYNIEALKDAFKPDKDAEALPRNPLYTLNPVNGYVDPMEFFPMSSMRQFQALLFNSKNYVFGPLLGVVTEIVVNSKNVDNMINDLKIQVQNFPRDQKEFLQQFFMSLFLLGMYARFWEGPGHNWPYSHESEKEKMKDVCDVRDQRYFKYSTKTIEITEKFNPSVARFVGSDITDIEKPPTHGLNAVKYDWQSKGYEIQPMKLYFFLRRSIQGEFCLLDFSDKCVRSSYFYLQRLFDWNNDMFNASLKSIEPNIENFNPRRMGSTYHTELEYRTPIAATQEEENPDYLNDLQNIT